MKTQYVDANATFVDDVIVRRRRVNLPGRCPKCKADLTQPESVRAGQYSFEFQLCNVGSEERDFDWGHLDRSPCDTESLVIGYECRRCHHVVINGEELMIHSEEDEHGNSVEGAELIFKGLVELQKQQATHRQIRERFVEQLELRGLTVEHDGKNNNIVEIEDGPE